jgi:rhamnosyltransferase
MDHLTQSTPPKPSEICALIVTFHPDQEFEKRVKAIRPQVGNVVIVDNGSRLECVAHLKSISGVEFVWNQSNMGLATALNQGIERAIALGFKWVFTLDHDTVVTSNCIEKCVATFNQYPAPHEVGIIGCNYQNRTTGEYCRLPRDEQPWDEVRTVITSGSLMPTELFVKIGPFRDQFFIDCLDFEYCLRARQYGYKILFSLPVGMIHNEGEKSRHRFLMWNVVTHNHSPLRRYYIFRNGVRLIQEYWLKESKWVLGECRNLAKELLAIVLFETGKWRKLKAIAKGTCHGLSGRFGKLETL